MTDTHLADIDALLVLSRLRVQNANSIPGPLSWGFPAPTAFVGFAHALERRAAAAGADLQISGVGIVCHRFEPQVSCSAGGWHRVFHVSRNPLGHDEKPAAFLVEGRAHMEVSLVLAVTTDDDEPVITAAATASLGSMRLAGGSLLPAADAKAQIRLVHLSADPADNNLIFKRLCRRLLPGFALVQRADLLQGRLAELRAAQSGDAPTPTALDALLDLCRLNHEPAEPDPDDPERIAWRIRRRPGWLVPVPVGYAAISPPHAPGAVRNARDPETPFRFVESLYSLGEWRSPHRLSELTQLLWTTETDPDAGIYQCVNRCAAEAAPMQPA
jgi:CRISPR-associated protein Csy2